MRYTHHAFFKTTIPDDTVDDGEDITHFGGMNVLAAISDLILRLGGSFDSMWAESEAGWQGLGRYKSAGLLLQAGNWDQGVFLLLESSTRGSLFRKAPPPTDFNELLIKLSDAMNNDPRFSEIKWARESGDLLPDRVGQASDSPVFDT